MVYTYDDREQLFSGHTGRLFILLTTLWFCVSLTSRLLPPLLPEIIDTLGITSFLAGVALTIERIARASAEFPSGQLADQLSRTAVLIGCVGFAIVGIAILSIAYTYLLFVIGVIVFGIGRGMYSPASRALLSDVFYEKRGRAFGLHMMGSEAAGVAGSGISIVIVTYATWRTAFAPLALVLCPLLIWFYFLSREPVNIEPFSLHIKKKALEYLALLRSDGSSWCTRFM
jgi:predicted MFS family arabinose efflux permease